jgi:hypothetical protein
MGGDGEIKSSRSLGDGAGRARQRNLIVELATVLSLAEPQAWS